MKKQESFILTLTTLLALCACGEGYANQSNAASNSTEDAASADPSTAQAENKPTPKFNGGPFGGRGDRDFGKRDGANPRANKAADKVLQAMIAETVPLFQQHEYKDAETGLTLPYNLFLPENYDESQRYPVVVFIADMSAVGKDLTAPLTQGYGGVIWATKEEQKKHKSIVLVPEFPVTILDDHGAYVTTEYVDMTARLIKDVVGKYAGDANRIYVTGQSMGCMTFLLLASKYPDLFAAELFVSGQWDVSELGGIASQTCFYITSQGDQRASEGQRQLYDALTARGVAINGIDEWNARWSQEEFDKAVQALLNSGNASLNFATFAAGGTLPEGAQEGASEHMTSFDFVYKIDAVRDWLFKQSKSASEE